MKIPLKSRATISVDVRPASVKQHSSLVDMWSFHESTLRSVWKKCHLLHATALNDADPSYDTIITSDYIVASIDILQEYCHIIPMINIQMDYLTDVVDVSYHVPTQTISLLNCLRHSPAKLNPILKLFVCYQIMSAVERLHCHRLVHLQLTLDNIYINEGGFVSLGGPNFLALYERCEQIHQEEMGSDISTISRDNVQCQLTAATMKWLRREISNFDYLMFLNKIAGRRYGDPTHHYMMPWVTDFTVKYGGFRDLTKTKYRLNKGDAHMDMQYLYGLETMPLDVSALHSPWKVRDCCNANSIIEKHPPHHISDAMCEITYHSYKARQTPQHVLCQVVRSVWRPQEYPSSIQRMYNWTPDECIPEFYTDATIFTSIHEDMMDLALPEWCANAEEFIEYHCEMLESDTVSENLHHWIDLTFGYKLLGQEAIDSKNVHLHLVDNHQRLSETGVICLFTVPHPARFNNRIICETYGIQRPLVPDLSTLKSEQFNMYDDSQLLFDANVRNSLLLNYDPLFLLEQHQAVYNFIASSSGSAKLDLSSKKPTNTLFLSDLLAEDALSLACLMVEIFLFDYFVWEDCHQKDLKKRVHVCRSLIRRLGSRLPDAIRNTLESILEPHVEEEMELEDLRLHCPSVLYFPIVFQFPAFLMELTSLWLRSFLIGQLWDQRVNNELEHVSTMTTRQDRLIADMGNFLDDFADRGLCNSFEFTTNGPLAGVSLSNVVVGVPPQTNHGLLEGTPMKHIVLPLILHLLNIPQMAISTLWHTFTPLCQLLDMQTRCQIILPAVLRVYQLPAGPTRRSKMMKLYDKTFLKQLLHQFGLTTFLEHFTPLLMETVAGCKQWSELVPTDDDEEEEEEEVGDVGNRETMATNASDDVSETSEDIMLEGGLEFLSCTKTADSDSTFGDSPCASPLPTEWKQSIQSVSSTGSIVEHHFGVSSTKPALQSLYSQPRLSIAGTWTVKLPSVAKDSVLWLCKKLGPYITVRYFTSNILRMLVLAYFPNTTLDDQLSWNECLRRADRYSLALLNCLHEITLIFGTSLVTGQYLPFITACFQHGAFASAGSDLFGSSGVSPSSTDTLQRQKTCEGNILAGITFFRYLVSRRSTESANSTLETSGRSHTENSPIHDANRPTLPLLLPDDMLMDLLTENVLEEILLLAIQTLVHGASFPLSGSQGRQVLATRIVDILCALALRLGFELTRKYLTRVFRRFFAVFSLVHDTSGENAESMNETLSFSILEETITAKTSLEKLNADIWTVGKSRSKHTSGSRELDDVVELRRGLNQTQLNPNSEESKQNTVTLQLNGETFLESLKQGAVGAQSQPFVRSSSSTTVSSQNSCASLTPSLEALGNVYRESSTIFSPPLSRTTSVSEEILLQWEQTFTPALAHRAYIPLCILAGDICMSNCLHNSNLVQHLVQKHEETSAGQEISTEHGNTADDLLNQMRMSSANTMQSKEQGGVCTQSNDSGDHTMRRLSDTWTSYWKYNLGQEAKNDHFDFKQIRLCEFEGHSQSIRSLQVLSNENSFISAGGKDRTVRLWSISAAWMESANQTTYSCERFRYTRHQRPVWAAQFLPSERLVASCDAEQLHLWDPFTGQLLRRTHSFSTSPLVCMATSDGAVGLPRIFLVDQEGRLGVMDVRVGEVVYQTCSGAAPVSVWAGDDFMSPLSSPPFTPYNPNEVWHSSIDSNVTYPYSSSVPTAAVNFSNISSAGELVNSTNANSSTTVDSYLIPPSTFTRRRVATASAVADDTTSIVSNDSSVSSNVVVASSSMSSSERVNVTTLPMLWGAVRQVHCLADGCTLAWGYSTGTLSFMDLRNGGIISAWRAHQDEILQIGTLNSPNSGSNWLLSTGADQSLMAWDLHGLHTTAGPTRCSFHGHQIDGAVTCFAPFGENIITCGNHHRIGYYRSLNNYTSYGRLANSILKGSVSTMASLPVNRLLLLAGDNGRIILLY